MIVLTIKQVIEETPDTRTYIFEPSGETTFSYKAGQFITITINRNSRELRRSYSLCTSPAYDEYYAFTVKQVPNGEVSRHLFRTLAPGSTLIAMEPAGRFTFKKEPSIPRDIFMIAAGSGVTPVYSLLKQILKTTSENSIRLILQNRNEQAVIFHDSLHRLELEYEDNFRFINYLSQPIDTHKPSRRLNNEILEELIADELHFNRDYALFYICGPLPFMRMAEFTIRQMGFSPEQIKKEIFDAPRLPPPPFNIDPAPRSIVLARQKPNRMIPVRYPQTILEAVLAQNINIPYSCKAGICGSCAILCTAGEVKMKHNDVLTDQEVAGGLILSCVGYAVSDITIDL
ncbi:2Fe-2S iron-sulfur cluster-binding protein [Flavitalea antarctica]